MVHSGALTPRQYHPPDSRFMKVTAAAAAAALLFLLYGNWLYRATPTHLEGAWMLLGPLALFADFLNPLFASYVTFGLIYGTCLLVMAAGLRWGGFRGAGKVGMTAALLVALAFPLLVPALYGQYEPYAKPDADYSMQWITQPANGWSSAFKSAQRVHEKRGCTHHLQGWSAVNELYFGSDCSATIWRYSPVTGSREPVTGSLPPMTSWGNVVVDRGSGSPGGTLHYPAHPSGFDSASRNDIITYESATSADGQWSAAAIMNYYGPTDVVILHKDR